MSAAVKRSANPDRKVVAVIGDGSMTGGMAYEGLNNLGHSGSRVVVILNDNGRSYTPTVSRLSESLTRLRLHPGLKSVRSRVEDALRDLPAVGSLAYSSLQGMYSAIREIIEPPVFFESSASATSVRSTATTSPAWSRPCTRPASSTGRLSSTCSLRRGGVTPPPRTTTRRTCTTPRCSTRDRADTGPSSPTDYTQAFNEALLEIGKELPQVVAITAAMPGPTGLLPFQARWPDRFFDVGIAEQHAVTSAAGMAMGVCVPSWPCTPPFQPGLRPGQPGRRIARPARGIRPRSGRDHRRGRAEPPRRARHGPLLKVPGMAIFAPSSLQDLPVMLRTAIEMEGPAAIRYPKGAARSVAADQVGSGLSALRLREGDGEVCILAVGKMVEAAEVAVGILVDEGINPTLWDVRLVRPLDPAMVTDAARHRLVVTVEDGIRVGGAGTFMADAIADLQESARAPPVLSLGTPTAYIPTATRRRSSPNSAWTARGSPPPPRRPCSGPPPSSRTSPHRRAPSASVSSSVAYGDRTRHKIRGRPTGSAGVEAVVQEVVVGLQVEEAVARVAEQDDRLGALLLGLQGLVDGGPDGVAGLGCRDRALGAGELDSRLENFPVGQITPSQIICFQVPGGATLGPVHKCPQFHNLGIEPLWFETAVLALPPAKALPRTG